MKNTLLEEMPEFVFEIPDEIYREVFEIFYFIREMIIIELTKNKILNHSHINILYNSLDNYLNQMFNLLSPIQGLTLYEYLFTYLKDLKDKCIEEELYENAENIKRILDKV